MKPCSICNSDVDIINDKEVRCSNKKCKFHKKIFTIKEWNLQNPNSDHETYFVTYESPGTLCSESTTIKINAINQNDLLKKAVDKSQEIHERHSSYPYGFNIRGSKSFYYLPHCEVISIKNIEVCEENSTLLYNITQYEDVGAIVKTTKGWAITRPFGKNSYLLDKDGVIIIKGKDYKVDNKKMREFHLNIVMKYSFNPTNENRNEVIKELPNIYS